MLQTNATTFVRFPNVSNKLGLGCGMDLPWGKKIGFIKDSFKGDTITPKMNLFFKKYRGIFNYLSFAFQPKDRNHFKTEMYFDAYDSLFSAVPDIQERAFHHTILNMGTMEIYDKKPIITFTNKLIERYKFKWIVEDLGIWSIRGKSLPYPLPPFLTDEGLNACINNVRVWQEHLNAPLCIEFPGFSEGTSFFIGNYDAFDYFRIVAEETGSPVTIDIGHILSYQWLKNRTGERMFDELDRLPLAHCFEFHLSGCFIHKGKFRDLHHGILLEQQLDLLEFLLPRCPNLKAVTYEDPKYTNDGVLISKSQTNFLRMKKLVEEWSRT